MEILNTDTNSLKKVALILGFFDGVHLGHISVIKSAVNYAKTNNAKTLLLTFKQSPAEYFANNPEYIFPRTTSYKLIEKQQVDYLLELDFSQIVNIKAEEYLQNLINKYEPISISTGFNHTFGLNKSGNSETLKKNAEKYGYKYFCIEPFKINNDVVSSTLIKTKLKNGYLEEATNVLSNPFSIKSEVIHGVQLGRKLGFPTANMIYPENIVKIPHGVYYVQALGRKAILNWGVKPTVDGTKELMEVHIPNYDGNLYGEILEIQILKKIRDEKKFSSTEELKKQIQEDLDKCLKL